MYYPDEVIEEVRMKNDIVDVISGYVKLQKKGANYFGLCPFHNEKSPSFSVSPGKQMYYCFGCGAGGNVLTFVMEYENYTFQEALTALADRAGVSLPKMEYSKEAREQAEFRSRLLEVNKLAANYFYYQLKQPQGKAGYEYFKEKRGLTDETILRFGLGYSNKTSDDLYRFLREKGYEDSFLKETGLVTVEERGGRDKFWNRVMFPIMDVNNRVIGFGGRVMGEGEPKYLNSPETRLFDKSRSLYGLNYARTTREKFMLICEGYLDVISLHQAGFTNAVASLGTAFTSQHAGILKRYTDQVILTYDSDGAGVKAALRAIPILREVGLSARILNMSPCKDPDEFIKQMSEGVWLEELERKTLPCKVRKQGERRFSIILTQGLNRQIRRMCQACGYRVHLLRRVRIMNIQLGGLKTGEYRKITGEEYKRLIKLLEGSTSLSKSDRRGKRYVAFHSKNEDQVNKWKQRSGE